MPKTKKAKKTARRKKNSNMKKKLGKKNLKPFKDSLIKLKIDLLKDIKQLTNETLKQSQREASGDLSGYAYHMADMASDVSERDLFLKLASGERELLLSIEEALKRIEEGTYGSCLSCNKKIAKTRLKAIPNAPNCRGCQEKEEKKR